MVQRKLSFDVNDDKVTAIATYVRKNVSSISFKGKMSGVKVRSANIEIGTVTLFPSDNQHWDIRGHAHLEYQKGDGYLTQTFLFSSDCQLSKGENGEPIVSNLIHLIICNFFTQSTGLIHLNCNLSCNQAIISCLN